MKLKLDQHSPIYLQIIDEFKRQIARGDLRPGDRIPSQRELAMMVQVNPNTVQRAYREMELMGITETLRGQGTFITQDPERLAAIRREMASRALVGFVQEMHALGYGRDEMIEMVRGTWDELFAAQAAPAQPGAPPQHAAQSRRPGTEGGESRGDGRV